MTILGKLICAMTGKHKRGKRVIPQSILEHVTVKVFECPRCGATWTRKVKS